MRKNDKSLSVSPSATDYPGLFKEVSVYLEQARQTNVRTGNAVMTATYWLVGQRIVRFELGGNGSAAYGEGVLRRLAADISARFGRGFGLSSLKQMRAFYLLRQDLEKGQTLSGL